MNEQGLVLEGKGTRDWTDEQQKQITEKGKAYDNRGRAFEGQHMKSVSAYPEYQDDARNIQLLSREEHLAAHGGNWKNQTNGYYDPVSQTMSDFGDGPPQPCSEAPLANPLYADPPKAISTPTSRRGSESVNLLADTTADPRGNLRRMSKSLERVTRQMLSDPRVRALAVSLALAVAKEAWDSADRDRSSGGGRIDASTTHPSTRTVRGSGAGSPGGTRQSPDEHGVTGYTRKNGTKVQPYRRGKK